MNDKMTITVSVNSGANVHSRNESKVSLINLGFETREEWDSATEEYRHEAVRDYWEAKGLPEFSYED